TFFSKEQESRPASAQRVTIRAFSNPALGDQLFRDRRDSTSLQSGVTSEVRARNRLMATDQVQHDAPVYVARSFACRNLKICQINLAHADLIRGANYITARNGLPIVFCLMEG